MRNVLLQQDATYISQAFSRGELNPVAVFEECYLHACHSSNVFISTLEQRGRREAEASYQRWKVHQPLSFFDGIPISWKDLFDIIGTITTAGSLTRKQEASNDADLVNLVTRAGMVNIGKTNLTEFAYSGLGINPHFGTPRNYYSQKDDYIPGGSSSGSAISVASGIVPISFGTDTAGSIRIPAAFNGIIGYRSSQSRYSQKGLFPLAKSLDTVGILAKSVRDIVALDNIIQGKDRTTPPKQLSVKALRIYVDPVILEDTTIEQAVRANLLNYVEKLVTAGIDIQFKKIESFHQALKAINDIGWLGSAEAAVIHEALINGAESKLLDPLVLSRLKLGLNMPAINQVKLYQLTQRLKHNIQDELDGCFLLTPTVAHVSPLLKPLENDPQLFAKINLATLRLTMPGSMMDMAAIALPSGFDHKNLPTSILLSAPTGEDENLLRAALAIENILLAEQ